MTDDRRQVGIEFTTEGADTAARDVERVADALDEISDDATTARVETDTRQAQRDVRSFEDQLDDLTDDGRELRIEFRAQVLRRQVSNALRDLERLEDPVEIEARTSDLERAQGELRDLSELAARKYEIEIDADPKRSVRQATDDVDALRGRGEAFQSLTPSLRGFTDELGGSAQAAGIAGQAVADLGDSALILGERFGISSGALTAFGTALGGLAVATIALGPAFQKLTEASRARDAFNAENVEAYDAALEEVGIGLDGITQKLTEAGKVELSLLGGTLDASGVLADFGLTAERTARLVDAGIPAIEEWAEAMKANGNDTQLVSIAQAALTSELESYEESLRNATSTQAFLTEELDQTSDAAAIIQSEIDAAAQRIRRFGTDGEQAADRVRTSLERARDAMDWERNVLRASRTAVGALDAITSSSNVTREQILDAKIAVDDWGRSIEDLPESAVTEVQALIDEGSFRVAEARLKVLTARETKVIDVYTPGRGELPQPGAPGPNGGAADIPDNIEALSIARSSPSTVIYQTVNPPPRLEGRDVRQSASRFDRLNGGRITTGG